MKQIIIEEWFPTQIMRTEADHLLPIARNMFNAMDMTQFKTDKYCSGYTSYFGNTQLPDIPETEIFKAEILNVCENFARVQGVDLENNKLVCGNVWMNYMERGCTHGAHIHGDSHYSGTFYINNPEGVGKIRFYNPVRQYWDFCDPPKLDSADGNRESCAYVEFDPIPGRLVMWNSWLRHEVMPHESDEPRMTISFNIHAVPK